MPSRTSMEIPSLAAAMQVDSESMNSGGPKIQKSDASAETTHDFSDNDEFGDFDTETQHDEFGTFDDVEDTMSPLEDAVVEPTPIKAYSDLLGNASSQEIESYFKDFLHQTWGINGGVDTLETTPDKDVLCTPSSHDLWDKLSHDAVFYNPVTGSVGQLRWHRSETSKVYMNAMGIKINYDEGLPPNGRLPGVRNSQHKRPHSHYLDKVDSGLSSPPPSPKGKRELIGHTRSASVSGLSVPQGRIQTEEMKKDAKAEPEPEPEFDIDIAKAYCELTDDTIRVFPDERLKMMTIELTRLQRQATEYLGYLLDQREQLMMDAETFNDLISCIVGHAQRLREQNAGKDASPAMVSRKKKGNRLSLLRRKQNSTHSTSMGGGVVGIQQPLKKTAASVTTAEGR